MLPGLLSLSKLVCGVLKSISEGQYFPSILISSLCLYLSRYLPFCNAQYASPCLYCFNRLVCLSVCLSRSPSAIFLSTPVSLTLSPIHLGISVLSAPGLPHITPPGLSLSCLPGSSLGSLLPTPWMSLSEDPVGTNAQEVACWAQGWWPG